MSCFTWRSALGLQPLPVKSQIRRTRRAPRSGCQRRTQFNAMSSRDPRGDGDRELDEVPGDSALRQQASRCSSLAAHLVRALRVDGDA